MKVPLMGMVVLGVFAWGSDSAGQARDTTIPAPWFSVGPAGGLSTGMMTTGPAIGAGASFAAGSRVTFEGRGLWMQRGGGASGLEATGTVLVTVYRGRTVSPYVGIGGGLYSARFDLDSARMFGTAALPFGPGAAMMPVQRTGTGMMAGGMSGTTWVGADSGQAYDMPRLPMFYAQRIGPLQVPVSGGWGSRTFTDPAMTLALGMRVDLSDRLYVRPDLRAVVPFNNGNSFAVYTATMGFGVRF